MPTTFHILFLYLCISYLHLILNIQTKTNPIQCTTINKNL
nr:MAG TPA: hypothetical protein [Caudoviricetes sp.]